MAVGPTAPFSAHSAIIDKHSAQAILQVCLRTGSSLKKTLDSGQPPTCSALDPGRYHLLEFSSTGILKQYGVIFAGHHLKALRLLNLQILHSIVGTSLDLISRGFDSWLHRHHSHSDTNVLRGGAYGTVNQSGTMSPILP